MVPTKDGDAYGMLRFEPGWRWLPGRRMVWAPHIAAVGNEMRGSHLRERGLMEGLRVECRDCGAEQDIEPDRVQSERRAWTDVLR
jgi:hypothetical protein